MSFDIDITRTLWEIDIFPAPAQPDVHGQFVAQDAVDLGLSDKTAEVTVKTAYGYLIQGNLDKATVTMLAEKLFTDQVVERFQLSVVGSSSTGGNRQPDAPNQPQPNHDQQKTIYVLPKSGVTDSVAENAQKMITEFGIVTEAVRTFKKYWISGVGDTELKLLAAKLLANDAIEQTVFGDLPFNKLDVGSSYDFKLTTIPVCGMNDAELQQLSKDGQLYLSLTEMQTIQSAFEKLGRDPTDIELETLAQTWSEHCSHKTLAGRIHYVRENADGTQFERQFQNMLKETIFAATQQLRETKKEVSERCVSVFSDNAGVVTFDDEYNICFKVETHNHPSALEPYGGANTGLGGVIRDPMGTGMGAKPVASTDVFCFAPPNINTDELPFGVLHPRRVMKGVVSGVRDYGNRMGIPTVNGAVYFDKRYLGNPLVFCGNIGILPKDKSFKEPKADDLIVTIGGRTGRDGIHGATFSSAELTSESETISGGAVQIGNAITEKMVLDVMLQARDRGLYNAVTDCGAGGFSSAVGEMGETIGAEVELSNAPLKYEGLSYTEIWISEAQERMVFSVPPEKWNEFKKLCNGENVEATVLGVFKPTGRLTLNYHGHRVGDLDMQLLHKGRPPVVREARYKCRVAYKDLTPAPVVNNSATNNSTTNNSANGSINDFANDFANDFVNDLKRILSSFNVASKHWIIRQYDHEVQGGSVIKPLIGVANDGPSDASVLRPRLESRRGLVLSCGMNPHYGDIDPYRMAASGIDEAVRNAVAVGADPKTIALLDNFCWGNTDRPETLGSLVEAALACYDVSLGFEMPFISGKDSLNNEFRPVNKEPIAIPPTLLISAMGQIDDVATCVTMDLKQPDNILYQIGNTKNELGGSHFALVRNLQNGEVPSLDVARAKKLYETLHQAIRHGIVRSVHDLSEGGLAVAVAEMCFSGGFGAELTGTFDVVTLFSESNSRFVVEIEPIHVPSFESFFAGLPIYKIGKVVTEKTLRFGNTFSVNIDELKTVWQHPLDW
ncbi:MAG: phosphoribosylformylglycinamidine synthase subunit PurL [Planctomycetaceae bacterium]|jgi:phosphoribosylformylglycinamidine synthase|nr:phosphoribosylformylglycinamidine synthase subunit PurL [Planctomycetaceae bacterium]